MQREVVDPFAFIRVHLRRSIRALVWSDERPGCELRGEVLPCLEMAVAALTCYLNLMQPSASPRDFAHFAAIASAEAESEEQRFARAAQTPPGERILIGLRLGAELPLTPALLAEIDARADGQMELARRRIALARAR